MSSVVFGVGTGPENSGGVDSSRKMKKLKKWRKANWKDEQFEPLPNAQV
jgi:hypothetical protein